MSELPFFFKLPFVITLFGTNGEELKVASERARWHYPGSAGQPLTGVLEVEGELSCLEGGSFDFTEVVLEDSGGYRSPRRSRPWSCVHSGETLTASVEVSVEFVSPLDKTLR